MGKGLNSIQIPYSFKRSTWWKSHKLRTLKNNKFNLNKQFILIYKKRKFYIQKQKLNKSNQIRSNNKESNDCCRLA